MDAGPEMDALVAEKVMGWKRMTNLEAHPDLPACRNQHYASESTGWWHHPTEKYVSGGARGMYPLKDILDYDDDIPGFHPSTSIAAAWEVVEKVADMKTHNNARFIVQRELFGWGAGFKFLQPLDDGRHWLIHEHYATAPAAICLAALKAVR